MELLRITALTAATISVGLMAGVFFVYSIAIMPGLGRTDDRTFVGAFQAMDRAIINGVFLSGFLGGLGFSALAVILYLPAAVRPVLPWVLAGFGLYLVVFLITIRVNVPLNDEIKAAGDPDRITDLAAVRTRFEAPWVRWNTIRTLLCVPAFGLLAWALVQHGRL